uniref:Protein SirB1 N-terminal domain-containing protein n=2 Tax=Kalanchoe fedtschenkoi TaxID=63787 RepID=A0A7N0TQC6_KALFE
MIAAVSLPSSPPPPWIPMTPCLTASSCYSCSSSFNPCASFTTSASDSSTLRVTCGSQYQAGDLKFVLHDALESSGIDASHAREAREKFCLQIGRLSAIESETSIAINRRVNLAKTALYVAAEDDSIVSHSSVPLPVDAFVERLDDHSMDFCTKNSAALRSTPENLLKSLERYLYQDKVLTHRTGSAAMLSLIYSEILKMIRLWGLLDFDVEIFYPRDLSGLPIGYHKKKSKESDHAHIMTTKSLLVEILSNLKEAFWPFQHDHTRSLFLRAAHAANCHDKSSTLEESGFELASAKAAQHRLDRGVWTSVRYGDMRRALSACERLILLETDPKELRDYGILLYHCGLYKESMQYLELYQETKDSSILKESSYSMRSQEESALEKLMTRLSFILLEENWGTPASPRTFLGNNSEPWINLLLIVTCLVRRCKEIIATPRQAVCPVGVSVQSSLQLNLMFIG